MNVRDKTELRKLRTNGKGRSDSRNQTSFRLDESRLAAVRSLISYLVIDVVLIVTAA